MNLLVTGGAGYVGSHCVRELVRAGHSVVVLDNLSAGHRAAVDAKALFVEGDLLNEPLLSRVLRERQIEGVLHFAAFLDVGESVREPLKYYRNNIAGSVTLLRAMEAAGVKRMVFSSTCATYGDLAVSPIGEETPQLPISPYGRTKLAIEWAMRDCARAWGLGGRALRYFNASGAAADGRLGEDHHPESHLIPLVLQVAQGRREKILVFGEDYPTRDGTCVRDYIHVEDLASAHRLAIETIAPGRFEAINLGTGRGTTVKEVIEACRKVTGHPIPTQVAPRREGDPAELFADAGLARRALNWQPRYMDIESIVQSAWNWHRSHPGGYDD